MPELFIRPEKPEGIPDFIDGLAPFQWCTKRRVLGVQSTEAEKQQKRIEYVVEHNTEDIPWESIVPVAFDNSLRLEDFIRHQHGLIYPSTMAYSFTAKSKAEILPYPPSEFTIPDLSRGRKSTDPTPNKNINAALALRILSKNPDPEVAEFKNPEQVESFARERDQMLDPLALSDGFLVLGTQQVITGLSGVLSLSDKEKYLSSVAAWNYLFLEAELRRRGRFGKNINEVYPALAVPGKVLSPDFFPYYFESVKAFMINLPHLIPKSKSFEMDTLYDIFNRFSGSVIDSITSEMQKSLGKTGDIETLSSEFREKDPDRAAEVLNIIVTIRNKNNDLRQILNYYQIHPNLLSRFKDSQDPSKDESYLDLRERVHASEPGVLSPVFS